MISTGLIVPSKTSPRARVNRPRPWHRVQIHALRAARHATQEALDAWMMRLYIESPTELAH